MYAHYQVLIIGGGTGGIMLAAKIQRLKSNLRIAILEPSKHHWYQPAWTLVGGGTYSYPETHRPEASVIPKGVTWVQDRATEFLPEENIVKTAHSGDLTYDYMVIAVGVKYDLDGIEGLREAIEQPNVCSNYLDPRKTWDVLLGFTGGNALFTQPSTPIKCGGAPQKIMYLADEYFRKQGIRDNTNIIYATPGSVIFGVKEFAATLNEIITRKQIITRYHYNPVKIDTQANQVHYQFTGSAETRETILQDSRLREHAISNDIIALPYDMLHLAPPHQAPDVVRNSTLAVQDGPNKGWLEVDIHTLQHKRYPNIYGLGDVAALPTAKTGAAIRKQAPVVAEHLLAQLEKKPQPAIVYEGYSSCPLVTGYGKMLLAEFKYDNVRDSDPIISKFVDTTQEQWSMWLLKKYGLPWMYWNLMLKGLI